MTPCVYRRSHHRQLLQQEHVVAGSDATRSLEVTRNTAVDENDLTAVPLPHGLELHERPAG
ncbi:MAG: hypothetical protein M1296_02735 [Chloroflexi bacterium]|nr:hypothetical protein [Chloroflexota bacterium]